MSENFDAYALYYDLLYREKNYKGEADFVHKLLINHGVPMQGHLLELGCGTGKHADGFARLGYSVHGVDMSPAMIQTANSTKQADVSAQLHFAVGDVRNVHIHKLFDAVISLFHVASYQVTNADLIAMFKTASTHLKPGGIFLFDCWYGPAVLSDPPVVRVKRMDDDHINLVRIAEPIMYPNENVVDVNYTVQVQKKHEDKFSEITEKHRVRYLFAPEVELMLEIAGMRALQRLGWCTDKPTGFDSWFATFVAIKE
jgi:SAM-dependent methyltransferase